MFQGTAVTRSLHTPSNYHDSNYQRYIRIFSLQLKEQPIKITMKQMFAFNHSLLKSVSFNKKSFGEIEVNKLKKKVLIVLKTIVLITTYVAIVIQFQIADENAALYSKNSK